MKQKLLLFAGEEIVLSHIVSIKAYEKGYRCYVEVKTATREYVEEFEESGYSLSNLTTNLMSTSPDFQKFLDGIGESITPDIIEINKKNYEAAGEILRERARARYNQIAKLI